MTKIVQIILLSFVMAIVVAALVYNIGYNKGFYKGASKQYQVTFIALDKMFKGCENETCEVYTLRAEGYVLSEGFANDL